MTRLREKTQLKYTTTSIFKCWCGENSYLDITKDKIGDYICITITQNPTTVSDRIKMAWKCLRGLEFSSSNSVLISEQNIENLVKELKK